MNFHDCKFGQDNGEQKDSSLFCKIIYPFLRTVLAERASLDWSNKAETAQSMVFSMPYAVWRQIRKADSPILIKNWKLQTIYCFKRVKCPSFSSMFYPVPAHIVINWPFKPFLPAKNGVTVSKIRRLRRLCWFSRVFRAAHAARRLRPFRTKKASHWYSLLFPKPATSYFPRRLPAKYHQRRGA